MKPKPINQQVVVIFGASSGIGRATALTLAKMNAKLVLAARNKKAITSLVDEITAINGVAIGVVADITKEAQVQHVVSTAQEVFGGLDTWINCAAVLLFAKCEDTTMEEYERVMKVNFLGQVIGAQTVLPVMKKHGGTMIFVSSVEAKRGIPYMGAYSASKHALGAFIETLRMELHKEGAPVNVVNIMPSKIDTPIYQKAKNKLGLLSEGPPPSYSPQLVADAIVRAAQIPERDIVVGTAGWLIWLGQSIAPGALDKLMELGPGFEWQLRPKPKTEMDPNNLYESLDNDDSQRVGSTSLWTRISLYDWVQRFKFSLLKWVY